MTPSPVVTLNRARHRLWLWAAALTCASLGCGGGDGRGPDSSAADGIPVRGTERIAWEQIALASDVGRYTFVIYVDDVRQRLNDVRCEEKSPGTYDCVARLPDLTPGRHLVELAAINPSGAESPRSHVVIALRQPQVTNAVGQPPVASSPLTLPSSVCAGGSPLDCYAIRVLSQVAEPVRRVIPFPDGRVLLVFESGSMQIAPEGATERADLVLPAFDASVGMVDAALAPSFLRTNHVYLAVVSDDRNGGRTASIVRVREVANRLGEAATVVPDLPLAAEGLPALAVDDDERIYVAMPAPASADVARPGGYERALLRFTGDGAAAGGVSGSPVLSRGVAGPVFLTRVSPSLLAIGSEPGGMAAPLATLLLAPAPDQTPATVEAWVAVPSLEHPSALVVEPIPADGVARAWLLAGRPRVLFAGVARIGPAMALEGLRPMSLGEVTPIALARQSNGDLIVAVASARDDTTVLLRLTPVDRSAPMAATYRRPPSQP